MRCSGLAAALAVVLASCGPRDCERRPAPAALCALASAPADTPLRMQAHTSCGHCDHTNPACTVTVSSTEVRLDTTVQVCVYVSACGGDPCVPLLTDCNVPALAAGDYQLIANGELVHVLHVGAGQIAACDFP